MDNVYIEVFEVRNGIIRVPIDSYIMLFLWRTCELDAVKFNVVRNENLERDFLCSVSSQYFHQEDVFNVIEMDACPEMIRNSALPAVLCSSDQTCIAGLCAVIRHILKANLNGPNGKLCKTLLGFRQGCLMACAEVSIWTRFCEIDFLKSTKKLFEEASDCNVVNLPDDLRRFECHLQQPLKIHNVHKRKSDPNRSDNEKKHIYAEGMDMMLSDVMIFACFHLMCVNFENFLIQVKNFIPLIHAWYERMLSKQFIKHALTDTIISDKECSRKFISVSADLPEDTGSLYIRDVKRVKPKSSGEDYDKIVDQITKCRDYVDIENRFSEEMFVPWNSLPVGAQLVGGNLPEKRLLRKCQQIDAMIREINAIAKCGDTIADFCSGGGHLGIPLAYLLPSCHIILIENKESSVSRARIRVNELQLKNVSLYQGNLDYYKGKFDIGVALHACGVATDLVIQRCIEQKAAFVCCPCCYGFIENTHLLSYPRSLRFQHNGTSYEDYLLLSHIADQTEEKTAQYEKGLLCMQLIDSDRLFLAMENSYDITLTKLHPPTCTPKNHLLIAIPSSSS